jgi:hypothetical protein
MSLLTTSAASLHQLGAAATLSGRSTVRARRDGGRVVTTWWSTGSALANALMAAGWMVEQHTIRTKRRIDRETDDAVRLKDICVIGAAVTNVANVVADRLMRREFPHGIPLTDAGELRTDVPGASKYQRYYGVTTVLNRAFAAGAIAFTPAVNFRVLKSYRPGTVYRLLT